MKDSSVIFSFYLKFILFTILSITVLFASAQVNRRNSKSAVPYRSNYQRISAGANHTLEIKNGTLWAWGFNQYGQLGDGTYIDKNTPVQIGVDDNWVNISAGAFHSLGLKSDGTLWAWGNNFQGQLGDSSNVSKNSPVQIGTDDRWISISAGNSHSLGLKSDGTLWAWGENFSGQLGDGTNSNKNKPVKVGTENNWTTIAAGTSYSISLKSDGTIWSWGINQYGQLGDGTNTDRNIPAKIGLDSNWTLISAGTGHCLGLKSDGSLWAWGWNGAGQLGDNTNFDRSSPTLVSIDNRWVSISAGYINSFALKSDGTLWACGANTWGQLGDGTNADRNYLSPIGFDTKWLNISSGNGHSIGIKSNGTIWAWGYNLYGQLGDGSSLNKTLPIQIESYNGWLSISANQSHSLGLKADGSLWAWGSNQYGQLGDGTYLDKNTPTQIGTDDNWISIAAGSVHSLGLKSDGTLWYWGFNNQNYPVQIGTDNNWTNISAGTFHSLCLKSDGTIWAWGQNSNGQLGDGTTISNFGLPNQIGTDNNWTSITAGGFQNLALKSDGTLWAWGRNFAGQLGDGTNIDKYSPVKIGSDNNWVGISSGINHSCGIKSDGTLSAWGQNDYWQLGDGTNIDKNIPVPIGADDNWITLSAGGDHSLGIKSNGTLWGCGNNSYGQLGDGSGNPSFIPSQIGTENKWLDINAGNIYSLGLKLDLSKYCSTGNNNYGQLGICNNTDQLSFVCNDLPIGIYSEPANTTVCPGNFALFSVSASSVSSYQWQENFAGTWNNLTDGGVYSGSSSSTLIINTQLSFNNRIYRCVLNSGSNCPPSDTTKIATLSVVSPQANISTNNGLTSFCIGDNFILNANTGLGYTYKWYKGGILLTGRNNDTLIIASGGSYTVEITVGSNCSATSSAINITSIVKPPAFITASSNSTICAGSFVTLNANSAAGVSRQWQLNGNDIPNAIFVNYPADSSGIYTLKVTNSLGCDSISNSIVVTVIPYPPANISYSGLLYSCTGNSVILRANQDTGYSYQWKLNGALIAGATDSTYTVNQPDSSLKFMVTVTSSGICSTTSPEVVVNAILPPVPICICSVDSLSQYNVISWEKPISSLIDSFRIYREYSTNLYAFVASVDYDSLSQYVDTDIANSNPNQNSERYKLSLIDICGNESAKSAYHHTILLQDQQNGNFDWNKYEIENQITPVTNYFLYRDTGSTGNWGTPIGNTTGNVSQISIGDYSLFPNAKYKIETNYGFNCTPTARIKTGISVTRSNIKNRILTGVQTTFNSAAADVKLHPNPAKDMVQITSSVELETISVYDNLGRLVIINKIDNPKSRKSTLNTSGLAAGVYTVHCKGKDVEVRKKLVVE